MADYKGKDTWALIHRYNKLVSAGLARPFTCPDCEEQLITVMAKGDEPALFCTFDDRGFLPGIQFWADVNAVVSEYYVEE